MKKLIIIISFIFIFIFGCTTFFEHSQSLSPGHETQISNVSYGSLHSKKIKVDSNFLTSSAQVNIYSYLIDLFGDVYSVLGFNTFSKLKLYLLYDCWDMQVFGNGHVSHIVSPRAP